MNWTNLMSRKIGHLSFLFLVACSLVAPPLKASVEQLLVIGVIASAKTEDGIVLVKNRGNDRTFAARVGQEIDAGVKVRRVTRDQVYFDIYGKTVKVKVGEEVSSYSSEDGPAVGLGAKPVGVERKGNSVKMTQSFRDNIVKKDLSKVLMQAAAVPVYEGSALRGFKLVDIEPGSVYELAGIMNGDIVTAINGQPLTNVGSTVKMLQSMKEEPRADISVLRMGQPVTLTLEIQ